MDHIERAQIRLILEHQSSSAFQQTQERQNGLLIYDRADGTLQSGAPVNSVLKIVEEAASAFVINCVHAVSDVAQDIEAFNLIVSSLTASFRGWEAQVAHAVQLTAAGQQGAFASTQSDANKRFTEARNRVFKELELHRMSFTKPSRGHLAEVMGRSVAALSAPTQEPAKANKGGKPLASHWDAMWAAIAVKLWNGDLDPKTQADIKAAMFAWFNENELEIGDTAVTQRARQLWQAIEDSR